LLREERFNTQGGSRKASSSMSENFLIKRCSDQDAQELSDIAMRAYNDHYLYLWNDDGSWYMNRSFSVEQFLKELKNPNSAFFLLKENEKDIGFLKLNLDLALEGFESESAMELERIYLLRSASRKGFGKKALEFCFDLARKMNKKIIWLKSMDSSDAVQFYQTLGFIISSTDRLDFEIMKPEYRGMQILMKKLD